MNTSASTFTQSESTETRICILRVQVRLQLFNKCHRIIVLNALCFNGLHSCHLFQVTQRYVLY